MSIEQQKTVEVLKVEVGDDYSIELSAWDVMTGDSAVVSLSWDEAHAHVDEVLRAIAEANDAAADARAAGLPVAHEFDRDVPAQGVAICKDCAEGKHGACIGSAFVENGPDLDEVDCRCTAAGHRGRS